jgi:hypothetical protein
MKNKTIFFAADNHYGTHSGKILYDIIKDDFNIDFYEDNWNGFSQNNFAYKYDLVILNMISGTSNVPSPSLQNIKNFVSYLQQGMPVFLLHESNAAFWQWSWWRNIVGFRCVKEDDPEGTDASASSICSYKIKKCKTIHPLRKKLNSIKFPSDELHTKLEQTCPAITIMEAILEEKNYPVCYETTTQWLGKVINYLPGHNAKTIKIPENIENCKTIINWLLN